MQPTIICQQGGSVTSVVVTSGDAYVGAIMDYFNKKDLIPSDYTAYGALRLKESQDAAQAIGNGAIKVDLLGFSDGAIYPMLITNWKHRRPIKSEFTLLNHVPYTDSEIKGAAQAGEVFRNKLLAILNEMKPTLIAFPDVMENDSDHSALGMFALLTVNEWRKQNKNSLDPRLFAYLIHWVDYWPPTSNGDKPSDVSNDPLYLPDNLPSRGHPQTCLEMSSQKRSVKRNALEKYKTQQKAMGPFLSAFVNRNECFTELKASEIKGIKNTVIGWQHSKKNFSSHPSTRQYIMQK